MSMMHATAITKAPVMEIQTLYSKGNKIEIEAIHNKIGFMRIQVCRRGCLVKMVIGLL